jgi:hypothetical protein
MINILQFHSLDEKIKKFFSNHSYGKNFSNLEINDIKHNIITKYMKKIEIFSTI